MVRPGDVGQQCSLNQTVPHPPWYWDCAPQPTATELGCGMLQALTLPMSPLSSLLSAGPTAYSCNIPIPSLLPLYFPQGAWNPRAITPKAHLWLCLLDPCAHLCRCSGNNLWVGCRAVFLSSFQGAAAGEAAQTQRESHRQCCAIVVCIPLGMPRGIIPSQGASEMQYFIRCPFNCSNR